MAAAERLTPGMRAVLHEFQQSVSSQTTAHEMLDDACPEIKDMIRKVLAASTGQQPVAASAAAWSLQSELSSMLSESHGVPNQKDFNLYSEFAPVYRQLGLPDLMQLGLGDLTALAAQTRLLDRRLRQWLRERSVNLHEYASTEEFRRSL